MQVPQDTTGSQERSHALLLMSVLSELQMLPRVPAPSQLQHLGLTLRLLQVAPQVQQSGTESERMRATHQLLLTPELIRPLLRLYLSLLPLLLEQKAHTELPWEEYPSGLMPALMP